MIQLPREDGMTDADLLNEGKVVLGLFRSGEDFSVLAANYSSDLHHAKAGDWGWVTPPQIKAAMRDAIFTLKLGDLSSPILMPEGCFIFYAAERKF
jgi:peptidyl-prolyl cis-trans isomerase SurA